MDINSEVVNALAGIQDTLVQLAASEHQKQASAVGGDNPSSIKVVSMGIVKQASYSKYLNAFSGR